MKRVLIGGIVAGIVVFVWGALSHMLLPTGDMGLKPLANEEAVTTALQGSTSGSGIYYLPGMEAFKEMTEAEQKAWEEKYTAGPTALIVYRTGGDPLMSPVQLVIELLSNIACALLAAMIIARISGSTGKRAMMIGALGLFAWMSISISYWNWYHFSAEFTGAEAIEQIVGWVLAGFVLAKLVKPQVA